MDIQKRTDIIEWDVVNWSRALDFWLKHTKLDLGKSAALEIGARDGGLSVFLAEHCKQVICSDFKGPTDLAKLKHQKYNLKNIEYASLDAMSIHHKDIDLVASKSVLGSFNQENQRVVIEQVRNSLREGGEYWFVENLTSTMLHRFMRKHLVKWGKRWTYLNYNSLPEMFSSFADVEFTTFGLLGAFGVNNPHRNFLGYIDKHFADKITPSSMHYIVAGIARK